MALLHARKLCVNYDDSGTVGKRHRRNDEIGTSYCVIIKKEPNTVNIRDRDSMKQISVVVGLIGGTRVFEWV